jgi:PAS domain S-box-containing protein
VITEINYSHTSERLLFGVAAASVYLVKSQELHEASRQVVAIMGRAAEADRCYIFQNTKVDGNLLMNQLVEWVAPGISVQFYGDHLQAISYDIHPDILPKFKAGEAFHGPVASQHEPFREIMASQEILSFLFLPIFNREELWGFIGYDACRQSRIWEESEIRSLQAFANAFGFFIENLSLRQNLELKNKQYSLAIQGSKDGIWELDLISSTSYVSDLWLETFGYANKNVDWTYENWLEKLHPDDLDRVQKSLADFLARGHGTNDVEYRMRHGNGHYVWVLSRAAAEWDEAGNPIRMVGSDADITERKIHERILAENESQYRNLVNNLKEVVFEADKDGKITFLSQSWEKLTGFTVEESLGQQGSIFLDEQEQLRLPELKADLDQEKTYRTYELKYKHKTGKTVWAEVTAKRIYDHKDKLLGTTGTLVNITDKRMAEKELQLSEAKYRLISENITDIITQHDTKGLIRFVSASMTELLGYKPEEAIGKVPLDFIHPLDQQHVQQNAYEKLLAGAQRININYRIRHKNGHYIWVESLTKYIRDEDDQVIAIQVSTRDISERKRAEEEIARALEKEKELMELRSRFIMMASHEFRTPLATIQSSLDILRIYLNKAEKSLKEKSFRHFDKMTAEIERLGELMNDILLLGKLEAGKTKLNRKSIHLVELCELVIDHHFSHAKDGRVPELIVQGTSRLVFIDDQLISHCIINLLSNALKFSPKAPAPQLELVFRRKKLQIMVRDFGIGIKSNDKKKVFEAFFRAENAQNTAGTGLGLVVVKEFVELHGGVVQFRSKINQGTTFIISINV